MAQLESMGFGRNGCLRAAVATENAGAEQAMEWVFSHMGDANFNDPIEENATPSASTSGGSGGGGSPEAIMMLQSMGFGEDAAQLVLSKTDNNLERAADWLFRCVYVYVAFLAAAADTQVLLGRCVRSHASELDALLAAASNVRVHVDIICACTCT